MRHVAPDDVYSRRIVGWAMADHLRTERVLDALNMAGTQRRPEAVIHHSDQGSQYTSLAFGKRCREMGGHPSTGSVGDGYENAVAESFFATLECELLARTSSRTLTKRAEHSSSSSRDGITHIGATKASVSNPRWPSRRATRKLHETQVLNCPLKRGNSRSRWSAKQSKGLPGKRIPRELEMRAHRTRTVEDELVEASRQAASEALRAGETVSEEDVRSILEGAEGLRETGWRDALRRRDTPWRRAFG